MRATAAALLDEVRRLGLVVRPVGDKIGIRPAGRLPDALRDELVARRAEVVELLTVGACSFFWGHKPAGPCTRCGETYGRHIETFARREGR